MINLERELENCPLIDCPACAGLGWQDIGDPEDGVIDSCYMCDGMGQIEDLDD